MTNLVKEINKLLGTDFLLEETVEEMTAEEITEAQQAQSEIDKARGWTLTEKKSEI